MGKIGYIGYTHMFEGMVYMEWTEKQVEAFMKSEAQKRGCLFYKFVSPGNDGVPDRILITKNGRVHFIELKTKTGRLSPTQRVQIGRLENHNAQVCVVRGKDGVINFFDEAGL